jgi:hypothetical protein
VTDDKKHHRVIHNVCDCGCSKLEIPHHLRHEDLWVKVRVRPYQTSVSFTVSYLPDALDNKGWEPS